MPAYRYLRDSSIVVSNSLTALIANTPFPLQLDRTAVCQWLCFGYIPSARTLVSEVSRLPGAAWSCADTGEYLRYWRFGASVANADLPDASLLDTLERHEHNSVARALTASTGKRTILLSSGWDSRALLFRLVEECSASSLAAVTFGQEGAQEVEHARQVASQVGVPITVRPYDFGSLPLATKAWAALSPDLSDNVLASLPDGPGQVADIVGDEFWIGTHSFELTLDQQVTLANSIARRPLVPTILLELGVVPRDSLQICQDAFDEVRALLYQGPDGETEERRFHRINHETRFRNWTVNRILFSTQKRCFTPFHDVDLCEFFHSLPLRLRSEKLAHRLVNSRRYSAFLDVPVISQGLTSSLIATISREKLIRDSLIASVREMDLPSVINMDFLDRLERVPASDELGYLPSLILARVFGVACTWSAVRDTKRGPKCLIE
jgi:hypothetical protein